MKYNLFIPLLFWSSLILAQNKSFTPTNTNTTERRFALVIGNKDYTNIGALKNPINDALDVSKAFQQLGFEVTTITNADYKKMLNVFNVFTKNLQKNDVVVFYYSGHGISYDGKNFLIPTDASIMCLEEVEENALTLGRLMSSVEAKNVKNSFVFLDACRNLPNLKQCSISKREVSMAKGLVRPTNNPSGSMTVYATREGDTADDNSTDRNGLFTSEFLKYINVPNLGLRQILDRTKKGVEARSNKRQSPARYDELSDDFVFIESALEEKSAFQNENFVSNSNTNNDINELLKIAEEYADESNQDHSYYLAKFWYEKALELGSEEAMLGIGSLYYKGHGVSEDIPKAIEWYEKAANSSNSNAIYELGFLYYFNEEFKDFNTAKYWFEKGAELNNSACMYWLGCLHLDEVSQFKNINKAKYWFEKSANLNELEAIIYLGNIYGEGKIEVQNFTKAKFWYQKACDLGNETGCENLKILIQK